jgi:hypothetical protein
MTAMRRIRLSEGETFDIRQWPTLFPGDGDKTIHHAFSERSFYFPAPCFEHYLSITARDVEILYRIRFLGRKYLSESSSFITQTSIYPLSHSVMESMAELAFLMRIFWIFEFRIIKSYWLDDDIS